MRSRSTLAGLVFLLAATSAWAQPGAPTNLSVSITNDVLDASWMPAATGETALAYVVHVDGPGLPAGGVAIPAAGGTSLSLPMTGLPFGTFLITVVGVNGAGQGPASPQVSVVYGAATLPSEPLNLAAVYAHGVLTVSWQPPTTGAPISHYRLAVAGPGIGSGVAAVTGTSLSIAVPLVTGLYSFAVSAVNAAGQGPFTGTVSLQVGPSAVPSVPLNFSVTYAHGILTLAWAQPATGGPILHYRVGASGPGFPSGSTPVTGTSISVAAPLATGRYSFAVSAVNDVGNGPYTPLVDLQVGPTTVPSVPLNLAATIVNDILTISWDPPASGLPSYYRLHAGSSGAGGVTQVNATSVSVPVAGAPPSTLLVAVSAVNDVGEGPIAGPLTVILGPTAPPSVPQQLTANVVAGQLLVSWNPPATGPVDGYVLRATGTSFNGVWTLRQAATSFAAPAGQMANGVYSFTVSAENAIGEGPATGPADVTIGPPCIAPAAPVLSGSASGGVATLSWTTPPGAPVTGYTLQVTVVSAGGNVVAFDVGALTAISGPLAPGTYVFRVTARSDCGPSPASNAVTTIVP